MTIWADWLMAEGSGQTELAQFFQWRFRDEFQPAFDEWLASEPLTNPDAAPTPFALPSYRLSDEQRS